MVSNNLVTTAGDALVTVGGDNLVHIGATPDGSPVADFSASVSSGPARLDVDFLDESGTGPTSWFWTFGDGAISVAQNPSHSYPNPGIYSVSLIATNALGSSTETKTGFIVVAGVAGSPAPPRKSKRTVNGTVDALIAFDEFGGDLKLEDGDLAKDSGLVTAVLVSLFSDARADAADLPPGTVDHRGWWPDSDDDRHGSKLWLLGREKTTSATVEKARAWTAAALQWLIIDEICADVDITAERIDSQTIGIRAVLHRGTATRWASLWQGVEDANLAVSGFELRIETV